MFPIATTRIMPLHKGRGRSVGKAIGDILDYVENPERQTAAGLLPLMAVTAGLPTLNFFSPKNAMPPSPADSRITT